jgi:DNA-binding PadR family transcriptional regulator
MAPKELKILRMLMDKPKGLYGSEMVALSNGVLGRGTIYTVLDRLVEKGFVREVDEPPTPALQLARTRHFITGAGQAAVYAFIRDMDLVLPNGVALGGASWPV